MIYLASPYTSPSNSVMEMRYELALQACADMLNEGLIVYSPIVHCHELAKKHDLPRDFEFWNHYNYGMLDRALELQVLTLEGWQDSAGVCNEWNYAGARQIPRSYRSI